MTDGGERGFTLIELLIAIVLLGIIVVPLTLATVTGITTSVDAQKRLSASRSPLFTSAFFSKDAQSAARDGITTGPTPTCPSAGTNVISFTWKTTSPTPAHTYAVSYVLLGSGDTQFMRRVACTDGAVTTTADLAPVLGNVVPAATATCAPGCDAASVPRLITLTVSKPKGGTFTLQATRRTS